MRRQLSIIVALVIAASSLARCASKAQSPSLFSDDFARTEDGLGPNWLTQGHWTTHNQASTLESGDHLAVELLATCGDCEVQATLTVSAAPEAGLILRSVPASPTDRYELVLVSNEQLQIRRVYQGSTTLLGQASSGLASSTGSATLAFQAFGSSPSHFVARLNGVVVLSADDPSPPSELGTGRAGLWATRSGVSFQSFQLANVPPPISQIGQGSNADGGGVDAGDSVDAGDNLDAGDAGLDAGSPAGGDAGTLDAGTADAGMQPPENDWSFYRYDDLGQSAVNVPMTLATARTLANVWTHNRVNDLSDANPIIVKGCGSGLTCQQLTPGGSRTCTPLRSDASRLRRGHDGRGVCRESRGQYAGVLPVG
jgi:hypothetical protein